MEVIPRVRGRAIAVGIAPLALLVVVRVAVVPNGRLAAEVLRGLVAVRAGVTGGVGVPAAVVPVAAVLAACGGELVAVVGWWVVEAPEAGVVFVLVARHL